MQPRPTADTTRPLVPSSRCSIGAKISSGRRAWANSPHSASLKMRCLRRASSPSTRFCGPCVNVVRPSENSAFPTRSAARLVVLSLLYSRPRSIATRRPTSRTVHGSINRAAPDVTDRPWRHGPRRRVAARAVPPRDQRHRDHAHYPDRHSSTTMPPSSFTETQAGTIVAYLRSMAPSARGRGAGR